KGWDYSGLIEAYEKAERIAREEHVPVMIHVREMTQPQGHSTSGSHERYKNEARLSWEKDFDCIRKMREWIIQHDLFTEEELDDIEKEAKQAARTAKANAWKEFLAPIKEEVNEVASLLEDLAEASSRPDRLKELA
ncbi:MAG TPA: transketolase, partial [Cryomorphaceae bacterium]|nr:transketolase [Cryomorphaceae bacterium]